MYAARYRAAMDDPAHAHLDGQRVGVGVGGDRQVSVRAVVGPAPQLVGPGPEIAEQGHAGIDEERRPACRPSSARDGPGGQPR